MIEIDHDMGKSNSKVKFQFFRALNNFYPNGDKLSLGIFQTRLQPNPNQTTAGQLKTAAQFKLNINKHLALSLRANTMLHSMTTEP